MLLEDYYHELNVTLNMNISQADRMLGSITDYTDLSLANASKSNLDHDLSSKILQSGEDYYNTWKGKKLSALTQSRIVTRELVTLQEVVATLNSNGIFSGLRLQILENTCKVVNPDDRVSPLCPIVLRLKEMKSQNWPPKRMEKYLKIFVRLPPGNTDNSAIAKFTLTYFTEPAHWTPQYDIHVGEPVVSQVTTDLYHLSIDYLAYIQQFTEENWSDVKLSLSTSSSPHIAPALEPKRQRVQFDYQGGSPFQESYQNNIHKQRSVTLMSKGAVLNDGAVFDQSAGVASPVHVRDPGGLGASYLFTLPHPVSIPSGDTHTVDDKSSSPPPHSPEMTYDGWGAENPLPLRSTTSNMHRQLIARLRYEALVYSYSVPSSYQGTQLLAVATNDQSLPLLHCREARVYFQGGAFAGTTEVAQTEVNGRLRLNLGPDRMISVTRTHVVPHHRSEDEISGGWLVFEKTRKMRVKEEEFQFTVESLHKHRHALVLVYESVPVSTEQEISVHYSSPVVKDEFVLKDAGSDAQCIDGALEKWRGTGVGKGSASGSEGVAVFSCPLLGNLLWVIRLEPQQKVLLNLKYKLQWPEEKKIRVI